jgi:hypothetical protein
MTYTSTLQAPARFQWDPDSKYPSRTLPDGRIEYAGAWNCGPSCVAFIDQFRNDGKTSITTIRRSIGIADFTATSITQQRAMLERQGVACYPSQPSVGTMKTLVSTGRRPIIVGLWMAKVPASVRDHPFLGMHAVVILANATVNGVSGFRVMDPNFSRVIRPDPDGGHKFYPDWVVAAAFVEASTGGRSWALVPATPKLVTVPDTATPASPPSTEVLDVNLADVTIPSDTGRLFDVKAGVTLYNDARMTSVRTKLAAPATFRLFGFHRNGSIVASNPGNPNGHPFIVPPVH